MPADREFSVACPVPIADTPTILMAHGGGGRAMHGLLEKLILPAFENDILSNRHDCALLTLPGSSGARIAFTTDSYVVRPLFFPGGDVGSLAVNGTVNDLAMGGARPLWLSAGLILEEGLPWETLRRVSESMRRAADAARVSIVTGDTKVVERGKGDGIFINTAGIGIVEHNRAIGPREVQPGDAIVLSGDIGRHGIVLMAVREGIRLETDIESDCAPLAELVQRLFDAGLPIHCLRDLTRGGLASALVEIAESSGLPLEIREDQIPVHYAVRAVCEILGLDPLHVANEGRFIAFLPSAHASRAMELLGPDARIIGAVSEGSRGQVTVRNTIGTRRILDMLSGEQLPRIC